MPLQRSLILLGAAILTACVSPQKVEIVSTTAREADFETYLINTGRFDLLARSRIVVPGQPLTIYIEGDGRAWIDNYRPSRDPTPPQSIVLDLAISDPIQNVTYLARPCQFTGGLRARNCNPNLWTRARFAPEVIEAMNQAVSQLKQDTKAPHLTLVGYSGGAAVAALIAAVRDDVDLLVTVAGLLDVDTWTRSEGLTPLDGSLNPADFAAQLRSIPQVHYVGARDTIVPPSSTQAFMVSLGKDSKSTLVTIQTYDHSCCWADIWESRMAQARSMHSGL